MSNERKLKAYFQWEKTAVLHWTTCIEVCVEGVIVDEYGDYTNDADGQSLADAVFRETVNETMCPTVFDERQEPLLELAHETYG